MGDLDGGLVKIETGVSGDDQANAFANATLQLVTPGTEMSVATYLEVPPEIAKKGEDAIAAWVGWACGHMAGAVTQMPEPGHVRFHVQIGPTRPQE